MSQSDSAKLEKKAQQQALSALLVPVKRLLQRALLLGMTQTCLFIVQCFFLATLFNHFLQAQHQQMPITLADWLPYAAAFLICYLIRALLDYGKDRLLQKASSNVRQKLRTTLLSKLAILGPERRFFGSDGNLSTQLLEQVDALDGYIRHFYVQQRIASFTPLLIAAAAACYSPLAACLLLLTVPLVPVFMIFAGIAAADKNREQLAALASLGGRFLDMIRGLPTLKRLGADSQAQRVIDYSANEYRKKTMGVLALAFLSTAVLELLSSLSIALVAVYLGLGLLGILPWKQDVIPVAYHGALFILLMAPEFYAPLRKLGADYHDKAKAEAAMSLLRPLLNVQPRKHRGKTLTLSTAPSIALKDASIHSSDGRTRLPSTRLTIASGERIAITGASGSGKSSLLEMLMGFADYQGSVLLNQQELRDIDPQTLRPQIAYLAQTPAILPLTIAENLRLARPDAAEAELWAALDDVELAALIKALPQQLATLLGERGVGLSGGQLQRLSIAQLLLRNAPLWLLDEPTAHLDVQTAEDIMRLLERLSRGKTVLLVSHQSDSSWTDSRFQIGENHAA